MTFLKRKNFNIFFWLLIICAILLLVFSIVTIVSKPQQLILFSALVLPLTIIFLSLIIFLFISNVKYTYFYKWDYIKFSYFIIYAILFLITLIGFYANLSAVFLAGSLVILFVINIANIFFLGIFNITNFEKIDNEVAEEKTNQK